MNYSDVSPDHRFTVARPTVVEQLHQHVLATPERIAVTSVCGPLSYQELWDRSAEVALALKSRGVGKDSVVGVLADSSLDLEIGAWAVLRAGGAYLPLSPEYPDARLRYVIEDSQAAVVLSSKSLAGDAREFSPAGLTVLSMADCHSSDANRTEQDLELPAPDSLAYLIYTSGSTGRPKGVMIEHRSIAAQMLWLRNSMGLNEHSRVLQKTPFSFDAAQWEVLAPAVGASVVMAGVGDYRDPGKLIKTALTHNINTLQCVPTLWSALVETEEFAKLQLSKLFSGGEVLTTKLAKKLLSAQPGAELVNLYGPTEATINASAHVVDQSDLEDADRALPIGLPVDHTELLVLDQNFTPVSPGQLGELCIAGVQLARGYFGRPEQTKEKFVDYTDSAGKTFTIYRTGDSAQLDAQGRVVFLGRQDNQVKINGHRIELDEVRLAVEDHRWVRQAAVVPWRSRQGTTQLAAFIELDKSEASLMDQGSHGTHHQSKSSRLQVRSQLSNSGVRTAEQLASYPVIDLPHREADEEQTRQAFERKTYRSFHAETSLSQLVSAIREASQPAKIVPTTPDQSVEGLGKLLRYLGPFSSPTRLLPKYSYASPGSLNASQIYLELVGWEGVTDGLYYFAPLEHRLIRLAEINDRQRRTRIHIVGKRERIEEVYATNVDEVLHFEAGHLIGALEEAAATQGLRLHNNPTAPLPVIDLLVEQGYLRSACVELVRSGHVEPVADDICVVLQNHGSLTDGPERGLHRYHDGELEFIGNPVVRRKDVIAINQSIYDAAAFGIGLLVPDNRGWQGFVSLGYQLHRLQRNSANIGLMSSGYSSLSGNNLSSAVRLNNILGKDFLDETGFISYFALGGGISTAQQRSQGMEEDAVHTRGPAEILKDELRELVPEYLVPTKVEVVDHIQTMPNGKVDLLALRTALEASELAKEVIPPRTTTENEIAQIWASLLTTDASFSIQDSFFEVGGNSLTGVSLINQLNKRFGLHLPLQALFTSSTVEALARQVESGGTTKISRLVRLSEKPATTPIFCWPGLGGYPMSLKTLANAAQLDDHAYLGFQAQGINPGELPFHNVQEMAAADVELIQQHQPDGAVICLGYSFGARVAFETAFQLEQLGRTVEQLILIAPGSPLIDDEQSTDIDMVAGHFRNNAFLRILLSVFTGSISRPEDAELLVDVTDRQSFIEKVVEKNEHLTVELVERLIDVVITSFDFKYSFEELEHRTVTAPITIVKAQGDDYSFLENLENSARWNPRIQQLDHDHYSVVRGAGVPDLAKIIVETIHGSRRSIMPHINIKHFPLDLDDSQRSELAEELTSAVVRAFGCDPQVVSISLEPVVPAAWDSEVYRPEIAGREELLIRRPQYADQNGSNS